jgi:DNA invertase Pin-like site-specific DNA recombinase
MSLDSEAFLDDLYLLAGGEITLEHLREKWSGRQLYLKTERRRKMVEVREAIRRDPCRDYRVVARRYRVSVAVVYRAWNEKAS